MKPRILEICNSIKYSLQQYFTGSKLALLALAYLVSSAIISVINFLFGEVLTPLLALRPNQLWGILTYPLIHYDIQHFLVNHGNLILVHLVLILFLIYNAIAYKPGEEPPISYRMLGHTYGLTVLISGVVVPGIATYIFYMMENSRIQALGASGICYALLGYLTPYLMLLLYNVVYAYMQNPKRNRKILLTLAPTAIAAVITVLTQYTLNPLTFLGYQPQANIIAHFAGFITGLAISMPLAVAKTLETINTAAKTILKRKRRNPLHYYFEEGYEP